MEFFLVYSALFGLYLMWEDRDHNPGFYVRKWQRKVLRVMRRWNGQMPGKNSGVRAQGKTIHLVQKEDIA